MEDSKRCLGLILGCSVGDAKGIALENKTKKEIEEYFKTNTKSVPYLRCQDHPFISDTFKVGCWTDDTQLTLAMCRSFIQSKSFNMETIVKEHCFEHERSLDGWGGTRTAIKRLIDKTHSYKDSGNYAIGNGVLMKISPLAFYYSKNNISWEEKQTQIETLSKMTHNTPIAIVTACILCYFEEEIFKNPSILKSKKSMKDLLKETIKLSSMLDDHYIKEDSTELSIQKSTKRLDLLLKNFDNLNDDEIILEISEGATFYCLNSMTAVIALLCSCECNFNDIERSIYLGGDTDSNASMVGAVIGGCIGDDFIPKEQLKDLYLIDELIETANKFSNIFI